MAKCARVDANDMEIVLPEYIIQHIQSFMDSKKAAQTTILSPEWHKAWLINPNLRFRRQDFPDGDENDDRFWNYVKETLQRYQELNIKIHSFKLQVPNDASSKFANNVVKEVLKMGITDIDIESSIWGQYFFLPDEVLQSETLVRLSLEGMNISIRDTTKVNFSQLISLCLRNVSVGAELFKHTFPCLEDLTIDSCDGHSAIHISSHSLKYLTLINIGKKTQATFDVPGIRKFRYFGEWFPCSSFRFTSVPEDWISEITVDICRQGKRIGWFSKLSGFLDKLSSSQIYLTVGSKISCTSYYHANLPAAQGPEIENVTFSIQSLPHECAGILNDLILSCRPKLITQCWLPTPFKDEKERSNNTFVRLLFKRLETHMEWPERIQFGNHELIEVIFEHFDATLAKWKPLSWNTLLQTSRILGSSQKIRARLGWLKRF